ncbi:MAG: SpoIIIAH-like family protein [Clostridiales bacterium]|nr:SpoIIIAH-like family protein [Clostridiales bacterium]
MVLKKKEIIAASLVLLIGMAGYLNWSYQDTVSVTDGESYIETGKRLGEAQYVSSTDENVEDSEETATQPEQEDNKNASANLEQIRLDRESARSKSLEILRETAENESFDEQTRQKAGDKIIETAKNVEGENTVESVAQSKGYSDLCVLYEDGAATIMVKKSDFSDADVVKLTEIGTSSLGISANNIKIVEVQ